MNTTIQPQTSEPEVSSSPGNAQHPPPAHPAPSGQPTRPTFTIACWLLALLAFAQLITVGTALTKALTVSSQQPAVAAAPALPTVSTPQGPIQPRSIAEILASVDNSPAPSTPTGSRSTDAAPPVRIPAVSPVAPAAVGMAHSPQLPAIADPLVERLVQESRSLHMDGDMMRSMLKLDEAERIDPSEAAVLYQKGLLFEEMGIAVKAADYYQKVQQMGIKAGMYFKLAADKLTKGMDVAHAHRPLISIGPMNTRKSKGPMGTKHANVSITILARPDKPVNPADVHVQIHFYDKLNGGEIKKASSIAQIKSSWGDSKLDWKDTGNEETLRVAYTIPEADLADEHLLGRREFYGYVVELLYKGEVIDQQAQPRRLHSVHGSKMAPIPAEENPMPWLPGDDGGGLLPGKDGHGYGDNPTLPPLPTR